MSRKDISTIAIGIAISATCLATLLVYRYHQQKHWSNSLKSKLVIIENITLIQCAIPLRPATNLQIQITATQSFFPLSPIIIEDRFGNQGVAVLVGEAKMMNAGNLKAKSTVQAVAGKCIDKTLIRQFGLGDRNDLDEYIGKPLIQIYKILK